MNKIKNILICPLEWGLGHATRMIPVIIKLREANHNIYIASGKKHLSLFRNEVQGVSFIEFTGFKPGYSGFLPQYLILLLKTPVLLFHIIREHVRLKTIIRKYSIDIVISDNRFGLWNRKIKTVYITHMPRIPFPKPMRFLEFLGIRLHRAIIKRYTFCFIPDLPGELNVSGRLSHGVKLPDNVRFIGILSRFISSDRSPVENPSAFQHNTVILSGPEPQRGILKNKLASLLKDEDPPTVILKGMPDEDGKIIKTGNIIYYDHLPSREMKHMITGSKCIITRSGYSTIMELISLNCSALLIPTPGQTEQEYLAEYLSEKGWFYTIGQNELKRGIIMPSINAFWPRELIEQSRSLLTEAIKELLEEPHK